MIKFYKFPRYTQWGKRLHNFQVYAVESEVATNVYYLADRTRMVLLTGQEAVVWEISDCCQVAKRFADEIKDEIMGIYADIMFLKDSGRKYYE